MGSRPALHASGTCISNQTTPHTIDSRKTSGGHRRPAYPNASNQKISGGLGDLLIQIHPIRRHQEDIGDLLIQRHPIRRHQEDIGDLLIQRYSNASNKPLQYAESSNSPIEFDPLIIAQSTPSAAERTQIAPKRTHRHTEGAPVSCDACLGNAPPKGSRIERPQ